MRSAVFYSKGKCRKRRNKTVQFWKTRHNAKFFLIRYGTSYAPLWNDRPRGSEKPYAGTEFWVLGKIKKTGVKIKVTYDFLEGGVEKGNIHLLEWNKIIHPLPPCATDVTCTTTPHFHYIFSFFIELFLAFICCTTVLAVPFFWSSKGGKLLSPSSHFTVEKEPFKRFQLARAGPSFLSLVSYWWPNLRRVHVFS